MCFKALWIILQLVPTAALLDEFQSIRDTFRTALDDFIVLAIDTLYSEVFHPSSFFSYCILMTRALLLWKFFSSCYAMKFTIQYIYENNCRYVAILEVSYDRYLVNILHIREVVSSLEYPLGWHAHLSKILYFIQINMHIIDRPLQLKQRYYFHVYGWWGKFL